MKWTWPCWRLIIEEKITYTEATEKMSITDIFKILDGMAALAEARAKMEK